MSVDRTIEELSGTLAQLGQLVGHINGQINGITSRINVTLDNFDRAITNIAADAGSVTGQVGDSVAQIPNSWVFYVLFITLIIVFILLSVVLLLNLITKIHAIYGIIRGRSDGSEASLIREDQLDRYGGYGGGGGKYSDTVMPMPSYLPSAQSYALPPRQSSPRDHVAISMESEPRRPGRRVSVSQVCNERSCRVHFPVLALSTGLPSVPGPDPTPTPPPKMTQSLLYTSFREVLAPSSPSIDIAEADSGPYQRRNEESGKYNLETATTSPFPRTIHASDI